MSELKFEILAIVNNGEVHSTINTKYYVHYIDSAKLPRFKHLMYRSPGRALSYLKSQCYAHQTSEGRIIHRKKEEKKE